MSRIGSCLSHMEVRSLATCWLINCSCGHNMSTHGHAARCLWTLIQMGCLFVLFFQWLLFSFFVLCPSIGSSLLVCFPFHFVPIEPLWREKKKEFHGNYTNALDNENAGQSSLGSVLSHHGFGLNYCQCLWCWCYPTSSVYLLVSGFHPKKW